MKFRPRELLPAGERSSLFRILCKCLFADVRRISEEHGKIRSVSLPASAYLRIATVLGHSERFQCLLACLFRGSLINRFQVTSDGFVVLEIRRQQMELNILKKAEEIVKSLSSAGENFTPRLLFSKSVRRIRGLPYCDAHPDMMPRPVLLVFRMIFVASVTSSPYGNLGGRKWMKLSGEQRSKLF